MAVLHVLYVLAVAAPLTIVAVLVIGYGLRAFERRQAFVRLRGRRGSRRSPAARVVRPPGASRLADETDSARPTPVATPRAGRRERRSGRRRRWRLAWSRSGRGRSRPARRWPADWAPEGPPEWAQQWTSTPAPEPAQASPGAPASDSTSGPDPELGPLGTRPAWAPAAEPAAADRAASLPFGEPPRWEVPRATKICPDCAEAVRLGARICRHCRHRFAHGGAAGGARAA